MKTEYRLGVDVGGTHMAAGLVDENNRIIATAERRTEPAMTPEELAGAIEEMLGELLAGQGLDRRQVKSLGVCVPGTVNQETGALEFANNLPNLNGDLRRVIGEKTGLPIAMENDANAAAFGEYVAQGRPAGDFIMITLGTGVGGGVILGGKLLRGVNYAACELGHMTINMEGPLCSCGRRGCFEMYGSAPALIRQATEQGMKAPDAKTVFDAYRRGDKVAQSVVDRYITYLAEGIANVINIFQPDTICLGGGVSRSSDLILPMLRAKVRPIIYSRNAVKNTQFVAATLYNDAGIIGAANLPVS